MCVIWSSAELQDTCPKLSRSFTLKSFLWLLLCNVFLGLFQWKWKTSNFICSHFFLPASIIFNGCFKLSFYNVLRATHTQGKKENIQQVSCKFHIFQWWKRLTFWILIAVLRKPLYKVFFSFFFPPQKSQAVHMLPARQCKQICFSGFPLSNQPPAEMCYLRWNVSDTWSNNYSCLAVMLRIKRE